MKPKAESLRSVWFSSVQFSSVAQSCLTLCDPMNRSTPGLPVQLLFPEFTQTYPLSRWCHPAISSSVVPFSSCPQSLPASGSFPMNQLFAGGGQSIGVSLISYPLMKMNRKKRNKLIISRCKMSITMDCQI